MKHKCTLKDCRLRNGIKIPEDDIDYSEDYPFNTYGVSCLVEGCQLRVNTTNLNKGE